MNPSARMTAARTLVLGVLMLIVTILGQSALAQTPAGSAEEKTTCIRGQLAAAGMTSDDIDILFSGQITDPQAFVQGRLGTEGMQTIGRACFPEEVAIGTPAEAPGAQGPEEATRVHVPAPLDLDAGTIECLKREVGEQVFQEVSSGQRAPTTEEMEKGKQCFPGSPPGGQPDDLPEGARQCVLGIIGQEAFNKIRGGNATPDTVVTPEQMRRVGEQCFGGGPPDGAHGDGPNPEVQRCLQEKLGSGEITQPTAEQQKLMEECFRGDPNFPGVPPGNFDDPCSAVVDPIGKQQCYQSLPSSRELPRADGQQCVQGCLAASPPGGSPPTEEQCQALCAGGPGQSFSSPPPSSNVPPESFPPFPEGSSYPTYTPAPGDGGLSSGYAPGPELSRESVQVPAPGMDCATLCPVGSSCEAYCAGGGVQGASTERGAPFLVELLLGFLGF